MSHRILGLAGLLCLFTVSLIAQGPPGNSGPPAAQPLNLLDSQSAQVGTVVGHGTTPVIVKYAIAGGDAALLQSTGFALSRAGSQLFRMYFFGSADCTGSVGYIHWLFVSSGQPAKRQAAVLNAFSSSTPIPSPSRLYVSEPFSPFVLPPAGTPTSEWFNGNCFSPYQSWGPSLSSELHVKYTFVEDLATKFTPPFWIP